MLEVYRALVRPVFGELILDRLGATVDNFYATIYEPIDEVSLSLNFADQTYQAQNAFRLSTASLKLDFTTSRYGVAEA